MNPHLKGVLLFFSFILLTTGTNKALAAPPPQVSSVTPSSYSILYPGGVQLDTVKIYERKTISATIKNTGGNTILSLWFGLDIVNPNGQKIESTRTPVADSKLGGVGRIDFGSSQGQNLAPNETRVFTAEYTFAHALSGEAFSAGTYRFIYSAWAGGYPGQVGAVRIGNLQEEPFAVSKTNYPNIKVPILMYHKVGGTSYSDYWVTTDNFQAQMKLLKSHGYKTITYDALRNYKLYGTPLPRKPFIVSFDDAWQNIYLSAKPILDQLGYIGCVSVPTGYIGNSDADRQNNSWDSPDYSIMHPTNHMIWPELASLCGDGWMVAAHSIYHKLRSRHTDASLFSELTGSRTALYNNLGVTCNYYCMPYGQIWEPGDFLLLESAGYLGAVWIAGGTENTNTAELYKLKRINIQGLDNIETFANKLGIH